MKIPKKGQSREEVLKQLKTYHSRDIDTGSGKVFGYVYDAGREVKDVYETAYTMFLEENALDFTVFPSLRRFETELVAMMASHLGGDGETVGSFTSGGTESLILAVLTARNHARHHRPEIKEPEMVLPETAHAAFHKAAHLLNVKAVPVPVDGKTFRADVNAVRRAITPNTILLVGSAPSYAHGVVDPIRELGALALEHNLLLHVDACMGGFLLPYFRRLGADVPPFDFSVPGVTTLSVDLHKYAYAPKGASILLHRNAALRQHQIFACASWSGYTVVNLSLQSSKSGGPLAAAWATLHFIGDDGYMDIARRKLEGIRKLVKGIEAIDGLRMMAHPDMCIFSFTSDTINVFHLIDEMGAMGWYIQPQLSFGSSRRNVHLSVNINNVEWVEAFLDVLRKAVDKVRGMEPGPLAGMVLQGLESVDPSMIDDDMIEQLMGSLGVQGDQLPDRMADINEILDGMPAPLRERILTRFVNSLFRIHED